MVLDLQIEVEGFALRLRADRPPGEILAGPLGCHRAVADPDCPAMASDFAVQLRIDGQTIAGETWVSTLIKAIKVACSKFGPDDHLEMFVRGQLEALALDLGQMEDCA